MENPIARLVAGFKKSELGVILGALFLLGGHAGTAEYVVQRVAFLAQHQWIGHALFVVGILLVVVVTVRNGKRLEALEASPRDATERAASGSEPDHGPDLAAGLVAAERENAALRACFTPPEEIAKALARLQSNGVSVGSRVFDGVWALERVEARKTAVELKDIVADALREANLPVTQDSINGIGSKFVPIWVALVEVNGAALKDGEPDEYVMTLSTRGARILTWASLRRLAAQAIG